MRLFIISWLLLLSLSCIQVSQKTPLETFRIQGLAQGTSYQIAYYATEEKVKKAQIEQILASLDSSLSIYKPYSLISRFNKSESGIKIDQHLKRVVKKSLEISSNTGGAFDLTIQPLVQAWGFGTEAIVVLPDSASILSLLECVGQDKIRLQQNYLQKESPCVRIDVNGIAQGYTVDVLATFLEKKGIKNYLVEVGGEIRVRGSKPGGELMAIGIEGPAPDAVHSHPIQAVIRPQNGAVTTSGNYRKFLQMGPNKISHLIDPKSGYPIRNNMISVTVWSKDAITADGYDNALMGMGVHRALEFAEQQKDLEAYIIYEKEDGAIADTATAAFYRMMSNN